MKNMESFYKAFEDRWRGSPEDVEARQALYLPLAELSRRYHPDAPLLDLGCGRGEWLRLLKAKEIPALGIDTDEEMVEHCRNHGLSVREEDLLHFLRQTPSESFGMVTLFHVVEHLPFDRLAEAMEEVHRILLPGGILVAETPNPENIRVSTLTFWTDPTHLRPLPPHLLDFLIEWKGFPARQIWRLHENPDLLKQKYAGIGQVLEGASPDYALIAQKRGPSDTMKAFRTLPMPAGLRHGELEIRFERRMDDILSSQEAADEAISQLRERFERMVEPMAKRYGESLRRMEKAERELEEMRRVAEDIRAHYFAIVNSRSWRLTRPLRESKQLAKSGLIYLKVAVDRHPKLRAVLLKMLYRMPRLHNRLRRIWSGEPHTVQDDSDVSGGKESPTLTPRGQRIFREILKEMEREDSR